MYYVIGDVHGAGHELLGLVRKIEKRDPEARFVLVGDCFDRGMHADMVWKLIRNHDMTVLLGNHERKMLQFFNNERDWLPKHYHYAIKKILMEVTLDRFQAWLSKLPLKININGTIIVHGGVCLDDPHREDVSANVYGRLPECKVQKAGDSGWWDRYYWSDLVVYGHVTTDSDSEPRIRRHKGSINSIGIDTWAVHGGNLTAYCIETGKFIRYRSCIDWASKLKEILSMEVK